MTIAGAAQVCGVFFLWRGCQRIREYGLAVHQARLRAVQRVVWEFTIVRAFGYLFPCIPAADPLNQYPLEVRIEN